jgi:hypothetical protein
MAGQGELEHWNIGIVGDWNDGILEGWVVIPSFPYSKIPMAHFWSN